jgi:hypothetical protein
LFFEDLEVGGVHDSGEEAIRVVHFAVVDDEGVVIGDENEAETAGLPNPGHLVGHSAGDLGDIAEVHDGDDRWQVLVPLEFRLFELVAAVGLGDDQKLENAVFYENSSNEPTSILKISLLSLIKIGFTSNYVKSFALLFVFFTTIMENIRYAKPSATNEEIYEATKKARIHDLIMSLPQKYDSLCSIGYKW